MDLRQHTVRVRGVNLCVFDSGEVQRTAPRPVLLFLHGMRDVAASLFPIAAAFVDRYRVVLPELRGHGRSDNAGAYSMEHFINDLWRIQSEHVKRPSVIIGHSLGGQIASRYAAVFPETVQGMVLVEGLGPPAFGQAANEQAWIADYRQRLLMRYAEPSTARDLGTVAFAASRLLSNNPRLDPARAQTIAAAVTRRDSDGRLVWAFDSHAGAVFVRTDRDEGHQFWKAVQCPTLVISGDLAHEYWRGQFGELPGFDGRYGEGEMAARAALFPRGEHCAFHHSGHMVHYDEPERLINEIDAFLGRLEPAADVRTDNFIGGKQA
jgi:pimeloyl-ACP methyl ester carboxylesterase